MSKPLFRGLRRKLSNLVGRPTEAVKPAPVPDFYLHEYGSYEEYKSVQIFHNKRKISSVWADEKTLNLVADRVRNEFNTGEIAGLFHGARNGFEQKHLCERLGCQVIGTDISDTATDFPNSVEWDFHDENPEWIGKFQFLYTNSLDQSWEPREALKVWLDQLEPGGLLFIEHTDSHGPGGASEMDPFGVRPTFMPYVLSDWFGHQISIEVIKGRKSNRDIRDMDVWLFVVKKLARD